MNNRFNARTILFILMGFLIFRGMYGVLAGGWNSEELLMTLLMLPGFVLGLTIHEYSHAKASDKLRRSNAGKAGKIDT